jgi:hypothetical protein
VAGGIDDIDGVAFPLAGGSSGGNGDATLALLVHPVHGGGAFVGFTHPVHAACIEEYSLGRCGFSRVNMGHDTDVAYHIQRIGSEHAVFSF